MKSLTAPPLWRILSTFAVIAIIGATGIGVYKASHSFAGSQDIGFKLVQIPASQSGLTGAQGDILERTDPQMRHVAKWLLSVGDAGAVADITAHAGISATTVGRVGANAGAVLQELARSLGDAGTMLLTPRSSEWEITVYWNERSVSEGSHPFRTEHAEALLTRILTEREVQMLTPLYTRPATLEEAYLAMAEGLKR